MTPITIGARGSTKAFSGHSTNFVKLNKKAAFTSYSPGWSDCAAAMVQTNAPTMSADRIQPTLDNGIGNCGHWSGEFKESIPHWRKRRASRGGPYIPERIQFGGCPHYCARNSQTHAAGQKRRFDLIRGV